MDRTYADLFTGFGGATIGAIAAGLTPLWGVEYDAKIAAVANANLGGHVHVADILDIDPHTLQRVDVLHASPPCPNFSVAKTGGAETALDLDLARKVARFVTVLQPRVFTLENVYAYRQSQSWLTIQDALFAAGYWVSIEHVNAADYGVPQTRQRMIVRAVRGGWVPYLPEPVRWAGWYEATEDLLPGLPDGQFAPWQLKRFPDELRTCLVGQGGYEGRIATTPRDEPANTVTANSNQAQMRAFIVDQINSSSMTVRDESEPVFTVSVYNAKHQAPRAALHGRVVAMTPRCLARFQSFPDNYVLPESKTLAAKGIGNAVAPLMYQRILEGLLPRG